MLQFRFQVCQKLAWLAGMPISNLCQMIMSNQENWWRMYPCPSSLELGTWRTVPESGVHSIQMRSNEHLDLEYWYERQWNVPSTCRFHGGFTLKTQSSKMLFQSTIAPAKSCQNSTQWATINSDKQPLASGVPVNLSQSRRMETRKPYTVYLHGKRYNSLRKISASMSQISKKKLRPVSWDAAHVKCFQSLSESWFKKKASAPNILAYRAFKDHTLAAPSLVNKKFLSWMLLNPSTLLNVTIIASNPSDWTSGYLKTPKNFQSTDMKKGHIVLLHHHAAWCKHHLSIHQPPSKL